MISFRFKRLNHMDQTHQRQQHQSKKRAGLPAGKNAASRFKDGMMR